MSHTLIVVPEVAVAAPAARRSPLVTVATPARFPTVATGLAISGRQL